MFREFRRNSVWYLEATEKEKARMVASNINRLWTIQIEANISENRVSVDFLARIAKAKPEQVERSRYVPRGLKEWMLNDGLRFVLKSRQGIVSQ